MMIDLAFYVFATILLLAGVGVIAARNPVHSVLFLILAFFNAAGLFVLLNAEFLAMLLVIVYVGAVMVLFLFVVMMLDVNFVALRAGFVRHLPLALGVSLVLLIELAFVASQFQSLRPTGLLAVPSDATNTHALGMILYTVFLYPFQIAGLILLVAMVGAIVLTHRQRTGTRRQNIAEQNARNAADVVVLTSPSSGQGLGGGQN